MLLRNEAHLSRMMRFVPQQHPTNRNKYPIVFREIRLSETALFDLQKKCLKFLPSPGSFVQEFQARRDTRVIGKALDISD